MLTCHCHLERQLLGRERTTAPRLSSLLDSSRTAGLKDWWIVTGNIYADNFHSHMRKPFFPPPPRPHRTEKSFCSLSFSHPPKFNPWSPVVSFFPLESLPISFILSAPTSPGFYSHSHTPSFPSHPILSQLVGVKVFCSRLPPGGNLCENKDHLCVPASLIVSQRARHAVGL